MQVLWWTIRKIVRVADEEAAPPLDSDELDDADEASP